MSDPPASRTRPTPQQIGSANRAGRALWQLVWLLLYRPSPVPLHAWRRLLLRLFGARIEAGARPYPRTRVYAPWKLTMREGSCLANDVDCYCVAEVEIGAHATVSQYSYLCTASHDFRDRALPLVAAPIRVGRDAWVAADTFVGPGVVIGEGAVVGARSTVVRDVAAWTVVAGAPPRVLSQREAFTR